MVGDGNVFSTLEDMHKYIVGLRGSSLLSGPFKNEYFAPSKKDDGTTMRDAEGEAYAAGFYLVDIDDVQDAAVQHNGSWYGTSTCLRKYLPAYQSDPDRAIIVFSNDESMDVDELLNDIDIEMDRARN
jgi:hypothetical protein